MASQIESFSSLEVPIIVRLGEREMHVREVLKLVPGSIIELPKNADEELDLMVNNRQIGSGTAVKIGENFGIRISYVGPDIERARAATHAVEDDESGESGVSASDPSIEELTNQLMAG